MVGQVLAFNWQTKVCLINDRRSIGLKLANQQLVDQGWPSDWLNLGKPIIGRRMMAQRLRP